MIILDTNVLSEPLKANGNASVTAWLDQQAMDSLYLTSITLAELLLGIEMLPFGIRRAGLEAKIGAVINSFSPTQMLSFDAQAARLFAVLVARARGAGRAIGVADGQIAAIAAVRGFAVATRNIAPFVAAGIPVINPWEPQA